MRKLGLLCFVVFLFALSGCTTSSASGDFDYVASPFNIGGDTLYLRNYTVSTSCDNFDIFMLFSDGGNNYYREPLYSMNGACSSALYIETDVNGTMEFTELRYLVTAGEYSIAQAQALADPMRIYNAGIAPSIATFDNVRMFEVHYDAVKVSNAASLYCAQTTCQATQTLHWSDVEPYVADLDATKYDITNNSGVIATLSSGDWLIDFERMGTGEFELPENTDPLITTYNDVIVDID